MSTKRVPIVPRGDVLYDMLARSGLARSVEVVGVFYLADMAAIA